MDFFSRIFNIDFKVFIDFATVVFLYSFYRDIFLHNNTDVFDTDKQTKTHNARGAVFSLLY